MMTSTLIATSIATLVLATGVPFAEDAAGPPTFQQIVATMNNVEWTIQWIDTIRDVSDVRLMQLDDSMGENEQAFIGVVAVQQGTAQVDALGSAIARPTGTWRSSDDHSRGEFVDMDRWDNEVGALGSIVGAPYPPLQPLVPKF